MNVLAAPFLFVLPSQLEAFACFTSFIETQAPRYVKPTLEGVHAGLQVRLLNNHTNFLLFSIFKIKLISSPTNSPLV